jgi:hypothetical protein
MLGGNQARKNAEPALLDDVIVVALLEWRSAKLYNNQLAPEWPIHAIQALQRNDSM